MKKFGTLLFIVFCHVAISQNANEDFLKINKKYNSSKNLTMRMEYLLFSDYLENIPFQRLSGDVKRSGELMSYKIGPVEMVRAEKFELVVDNDEQFIAMMEHKSKIFEWDEKTYIGGLDKILEVCSSKSYSIEGKIGCYDLKMKAGEWSEVKIYFNTITFLITKMVFYYRNSTILSEDGNGKKDKPRLEITYADYNENPSFNENEFSINKYVTKKSGTYSCIDKFREYTLKVDLLADNLK